MKIKSVLSLGAAFLFVALSVSAQKVYNVSDYGLRPDSKKNASPVVQKVIARIQAECKDGEAVILRFEEGRYNFHEKGCAERGTGVRGYEEPYRRRAGG